MRKKTFAYNPDEKKQKEYSGKNETQFLSLSLSLSLSFEMNQCAFNGFFIRSLRLG